MSQSPMQEEATTKTANHPLGPDGKRTPETEGSPMRFTLLVFGALIAVGIVAILLTQTKTPSTAELRRAMFDAIRSSEDIDADKVRQVSNSQLAFPNADQTWFFNVLRTQVRDGKGNALVEVTPGEGAEPFHANVWAEPTGDGSWRILRNEDETGVTSLWTPVRPVNVQRPAEPRNPNNPRVRLTTTYGDIELELWEDLRPNSVANFISLVEDGFYNGTKFHRIIDGFMIQGGDPNTRDGLVPGTAGMGDPGYSIPDEFDERTNFDRAGLLAFANSNSPQARPPRSNTSGSQFFITLGPTPHLNPPDSWFNLFGEVISGMDVVRAIGRSPVVHSPGHRGAASWPQQEIEVISAEVLFKRDHAYTVKKVGD